MFHICKQWKIECCNTVFVGDHKHDIECGEAAGSGNEIIDHFSDLDQVSEKFTELLMKGSLATESFKPSSYAGPEL